MEPTRRTAPGAATAAVLAAALGLGIGWLDLRTSEVSVTVVALLAGGLLVGLLQPRRAWIQAALLALGLPAMAVVGRLLHLPTAEPIRFDPLIVLVAFAFASAGCCTGAGIRRTAGRRDGGGPR